MRCLVALPFLGKRGTAVVREWRRDVRPSDASKTDLVGDVEGHCAGLCLALDEVGSRDAKGTAASIAGVDPVDDVVDEAMCPRGVGMVP